MIVKLADVGSTGWIEDIPAHDLGENPLGWNACRNMIFRSGLAERSSGYQIAFDPTPTQIVYGLFNATKLDGTNYLIAGGSNKAFCYTGATETEITGSTGLTGTAAGKWSGGVLTGFVIITEHAAKPQYIAVENLGTATDLADLTNWPDSTTCKVLRPFKQFLFAGDMTESSTRRPFKIRWSTPAEPGTLPSSWVASAANAAGSIDVSDSDGRVIDFIALGDQLACYTENSIYLARYIGGTDAVNRLVWAFNRVPVGASGGMMGLGCGCDVAAIGHVVLSNSDVYLFNGTQIVSLIDKRLRKWLFDNINKTNKRNAFVINNALDSEVWVCIPTTGTACDTALVWNYSEGLPGTWGMRVLPNATAGLHAPLSEITGDVYTALTGDYDDLTGIYLQWEDAPVARKTVVSSSANALYVFGNTYDANGSTFTAEVQRDYISFGDPMRLKFFRALWPRFDGDVGQTVSVAVGTSMSVNESPSWQTAIDYTLGTDRAIYVNRKGRFLHLRLRSTTGSPWRIRSIDVDLAPEGRY